jgi:hypothetical protein
VEWGDAEEPPPPPPPHTIPAASAALAAPAAGAPPPPPTAPVEPRQHQPQPQHPGINCAGGHGLSAFITEGEGYNCDRCLKGGLPMGTRLWGCRHCEYDVCEACWEGEQEQEEEEEDTTRGGTGDVFQHNIH